MVDGDNGEDRNAVGAPNEGKRVLLEEVIRRDYFLRREDVANLAGCLRRLGRNDLTGKAEAAFTEELAKLVGAAVPVAELQKARNQLLAEHYRELKTMGERANALGRYETFHGGWARLYEFEGRLNAVTAADVQRVAKQYLSNKNRTVATLVPEGAAGEEDDEQ